MGQNYYKIKEIFYSLQGEGFHAGRPAIFVRFTGCNLWSGREEDRSKAICSFCDTDFVGMDGQNGGRYSALSLVAKIKELWPDDSGPFVVCTGGEPLLQLDQGLVDTFRQNELYVAIETNGSLEVPKGIDWVCVSPKASTSLVVTKGDELKLVFPQKENRPIDFVHLNFSHFYLQPKDGVNLIDNTQQAMAYCLQHPQWNFSIQLQKILKID